VPGRRFGACGGAYSQDLEISLGGAQATLDSPAGLSNVARIRIAIERAPISTPPCGKHAAQRWVFRAAGFYILGKTSRISILEPPMKLFQRCHPVWVGFATVSTTRKEDARRHAPELLCRTQLRIAQRTLR
jgi:hypothetical protein